MNENKCILFQKGDGEVINSFTEWGIVCLKVPFKTGGKVKALAKREWKDENGTDEYYPKKLYFESYEMEVEFGYQGRELSSNPKNLSLAYSRIRSFRNWLSGNDTVNGSGTDLKMYSPYTSIGRQKVRLSEISDEDPCLMLAADGANLYHETVLTFKVKFMVNDPMTDIVLTEAIEESDE